MAWMQFLRTPHPDQQRAERTGTWPGLGFWKLILSPPPSSPSCPQPTYLLKQGHTHFNTATRPISPRMFTLAVYNQSQSTRGWGLQITLPCHFGLLSPSFQVSVLLPTTRWRYWAEEVSDTKKGNVLILQEAELGIYYIVSVVQTWG